MNSPRRGEKGSAGQGRKGRPAMTQALGRGGAPVPTRTEAVGGSLAPLCWRGWHSGGVSPIASLSGQPFRIDCCFCASVAGSEVVCVELLCLWPQVASSARRPEDSPTPASSTVCRLLPTLRWFQDHGWWRGAARLARVWGPWRRRYPVRRRSGEEVVVARHQLLALPHAGCSRYRAHIDPPKRVVLACSSPSRTVASFRLALSGHPAANVASRTRRWTGRRGQLGPSLPCRSHLFPRLKPPRQSP